MEGPYRYYHVYNTDFNVNSLTEEEKKRFSQHGFNETFPVGVAILLHFVTLGIFTLIYYGLKFSKLPKVRHDDFGAGEAIGFSFIPFFNLYWVFRFWLGLTDRVNFQLRLRGTVPTVSRDLALATCIVYVIPGVDVVAWLILFPILIAQIESATNHLALDRMGTPQAVAPR